MISFLLILFMVFFIVQKSLILLKSNIVDLFV